MNISYIVLFIALFALVITGIKPCYDKKLGGGYFNDDYLSIDNSKAVKGLMAVLIIFHHLYQKLESSIPIVFIFMGYIGFILVALFFFYSGYGLAQGLEHKKDYLKSFFPRRFLTVYIPFWLITIITVIAFACVGKYFEWWEYLTGAIGSLVVMSCWFVPVILIFYALFYIVYGICERFKLNRVIPFIIMTVCTVIFCVVARLLNFGYYVTGSIFGFVFGLSWNMYGDKVVAWMRKKYWLKLLIALVVFLILFGGRTLLKYVGIENEWIHMILRNIASIAFILLVICILQVVNFGNKVWYWLGSMSLTLYIVHVPLLTLLTKYFSVNGEAIVWCTVAISIVIAWGVTLLSNFIQKLLFQKGKKVVTGEGEEKQKSVTVDETTGSAEK